MPSSSFEDALATLIEERSKIGNGCLVGQNEDKLFEIVPNVFLSNYKSATALGANMDVIINCTKDLPFPPIPTHALCARMDLRLAINDDGSQEAMETFVAEAPSLLASIEANAQAGKKVLVHCMAGQQRSCALVAAYMMLKKGYTYEKAISHIKGVKPDAFFYRVNFDAALVALREPNRNGMPMSLYPPSPLRADGDIKES